MPDISDAFRPFFNNYSIHLLQVRSAREYKFQNPDNRDFFTLMGEFYNNQGKIHMCTALENLKKEGRQEGIRESIREVVETYREVGYSDDAVLTKLMKKFQLSADEAKALL